MPRKQPNWCVRQIRKVMVFIWCQRGATSWDWQFGRVWIGVTKPQYRGREWWRHLGFIRWCPAESEDDDVED